MRKQAIKSDERLNPELKEVVQELRGGICEAAEKQPIPERFYTENSKNSPSVIITDTETGKSTEVSLYAYSNVRQALTDLFQ